MQSMLRPSASDGTVSASLPQGPSGVFVYVFADFRLEPENRLLTCAGKEVPLPGRAFDALLMLVRRPGSLLSKEELMASVWAGSFVEESNLTVTISTLRRALNEDPHDRRYIQTVARRGYRFIATVTELPQTVASMPRTFIKENPAETPVSDRLFVEPAEEDVAAGPPIYTGPQPLPGVTPFLRRLRHGAIATVWVGLLAALVLGGWLLLKPNQPLRTLAVLPFSSDSSSTGSAPNGFILLGMTDSITSRLEANLVVRPTSSVLRYSTTAPVSPVVAGREQEVDAVLTGQVNESGGSTQLRLHLIRVSDGLTLWQDSFRAASSDLKGLEQEAGDAASHELGPAGKAGGGPARPAPAANAERSRVDEPAYQLYLRGRFFWNRRTVEGLRKSTEYFRQAIDADPNYAAAYAGLADSYALLASFSVEPGRAANADARSAALSAIQLDPTLAEPHASLGMIYFFTDWNLPAAEVEFGRAIRLNPNYATAHHWYALDLAAMGRFPQALYEIRVAQKLDPLSLIIGTNVGWIEYLAHDYADALHDLHRVLELDPNFVRARTRLGMVEMATGDNSAAEADLKQALVLSGDEDPWVEGLLGDAQARAGNRTAAEHALAKVSVQGSSHYVPPTSRALILLGLGRRAEAVAALSQAIEDHSTSMVYARVDPSLDTLRSDPPFQALMTRMNQ
ncbi:transcriptional regulator, CadC (plasmid) [Granulicella tundricola MP5ACTX9]|uniref:Transcriptional regulator, CadC n=2 Tax=Granulicella TaxID=940557 RepID=E8X6G0_GRATM|nr:transcriptional regulator, CadC [Granulicella tundricola MP5ACTX9]